MSSYCDEYATSAEVAERRPPFAVLPVGAHEQHGAHLPLASDSIAAHAFAKALATELGGLLLPTIPYGTSYEHIGFPGTITLHWNTLAAVVSDVVTSCWRLGIGLVFVLSGHGGNFILNPCVRDLNANRPDGCRAILVPESVLHGDGYATGELHAGRAETAVLMAISPDAVRVDRAVDRVPDVERAELTNRPLIELSPSGIWGRPSEATRAEGERLHAQRVRRLRDYAARWLEEDRSGA